jgi:DNA-binding transcriptional LysR family regulator
MCRNGLAMKRLVRVLPEWEVADAVRLTAVAPASRAQAPEVRSFIDFLGANVVPALAGEPQTEVRANGRNAVVS